MRAGTPISKKARTALRHRAGDECEARLAGCPIQIGEYGDPHHAKKRSAGGSNNLNNLFYVCRSCHDKIERRLPGTEKFRTTHWQEEGEREG